MLKNIGHCRMTTSLYMALWDKRTLKHQQKLLPCLNIDQLRSISKCQATSSEDTPKSKPQKNPAVTSNLLKLDIEDQTKFTKNIPARCYSNVVQHEHVHSQQS